MKEVTFFESEKKKPSSMRGVLGRLVIAGIVIVLLFGTLGMSGYFYRAYQKTLVEKNSLLIDKDILLKEKEALKVDSVIESVSKLIEVPTDETPTVLVVSDMTAIEGRPFARYAKIGDATLSYEKAGRVIVYRPVTGKVVDITFLNEEKSLCEGSQSAVTTILNQSGEQEASLAGGSPSGETSGEAVLMSQPFTVSIVNGTTTKGFAKATGEKIKANFPTATILKTSDALRKDYTKTIIVDASGIRSENMERLAQFLDGEVNVLPVGETVPDGTDIFIVMGQSVGE